MHISNTVLAHYGAHLRRRMESKRWEKKFLAIFKGEPPGKADDTDVGDTSVDTGEIHFAEQVADLLVRSGRIASASEALDFLLGTPHGQALLTRLRSMKRTRKQTTKDFQMPTRQEVLKGQLKAAGGLDGLCRQIVKHGCTDIAEAELTGMITYEAKRAEPELSDERAFSKLFTDASPRGTLLRQAIQIAKFSHLLIMPVNVDSGDTDVEDDSDAATAQRRQLNDEQQRRISDTDLADADEDEDDSGPAYDELAAKAATYRKAHPELTEQQAFSKIYQDPSNRKLALRERRQNRPGG
jgi:hypothetical protein